MHPRTSIFRPKSFEFFTYVDWVFYILIATAYIILGVCFTSIVVGCVPVHVEVAGSLSWGDDQNIEKNSSSKVTHVAVVEKGE